MNAVVLTSVSTLRVNKRCGKRSRLIAFFSKNEAPWRIAPGSSETTNGLCSKLKTASAKLTEHLPKLREVLAITGVLRYQQLEDAAGEIQLFIPVAYAARQTPKTLMADLYDHAVVAFTNVESDGLNANDRADAESGLTVLVLSCERAQAIEALPALYRGLSAQPRRLKEARASVAVHYDSRPFPDTEALTVQVGKPMLDLEEIP